VKSFSNDRQITLLLKIHITRHACQSQINFRSAQAWSANSVWHTSSHNIFFFVSFLSFYNLLHVLTFIFFLHAVLNFCDVTSHTTHGWHFSNLITLTPLFLTYKRRKNGYRILTIWPLFESDLRKNHIITYIWLYIL